MILQSRFLAFVGFCGILLSPALAECTTRGYSFFPDQNDTVTYQSTTNNGACGHGYTSGASGFFKSATIIGRPKNGTLTQTGEFRFRYQAKAGYKGTDTYVIRVCGSNRGREGCSTLNYQTIMQ